MNSLYRKVFYTLPKYNIAKYSISDKLCEAQHMNFKSVLSTIIKGIFNSKWKFSHHLHNLIPNLYVEYKKRDFWKLFLQYLLLCPTEERLICLELFIELFTKLICSKCWLIQEQTCGCLWVNHWIIHWTYLLKNVDLLECKIPILSFWEMCNCALALMVTLFIGKAKTNKVTRNMVCL